MTPFDIQVLVGTALAVAAAIATGAKWLLTHVEALQSKATVVESAAREMLSNRLHEEIRVLRVELVSMHGEKKLLLRRIYQLETFIHAQQGISIPDMEGWPPL